MTGKRRQRRKERETREKGKDQRDGGDRNPETRRVKGHERERPIQRDPESRTQIQRDDDTGNVDEEKSAGIRAE